MRLVTKGMNDISGNFVIFCRLSFNYFRTNNELYTLHTYYVIHTIDTNVAYVYVYVDIIFIYVLILDNFKTYKYKRNAHQIFVSLLYFIN